MSNHPYECRECGSKDIEMQLWVNLLTNKTSEDGNSDIWCNDCEESTKLDVSAPEEDKS